MKMLHILAAEAASENIRLLAHKYEALSWYQAGHAEEGMGVFIMFVRPAQRQQLLDDLHEVLKSSPKSRISILPVDGTIPQLDNDEGVTETREELQHRIHRGATLDGQYVILALLSSIVALIGLLENNVAVVIGAMVIAPFLGPNLALAFSTSQGDGTRMGRSAITSLIGLAIPVLVGVLAGVFWDHPGVTTSPEVRLRTTVGFDGLALAFASGVAGVLSLAGGLSATLVGVMVAVALLPPAVVLGLMLGMADMGGAAGAFLLLSVNLVCVNFAGLLVFLVKGFAPRTWYERKQAKPHVYGGMVVWTLLLVLLLVAVSLLDTSANLLSR